MKELDFEWKEMGEEDIVKEVAEFSDFLTDVAQDVESFAGQLVEMAHDGATEHEFHQLYHELGWGQELVESLQAGICGASVTIDVVYSMIVERGRWEDKRDGEEKLLSEIFG
jgi:hypothetical protein